jgi:lipase chaperone LimK
MRRVLLGVALAGFAVAAWLALGTTTATTTTTTTPTTRSTSATTASFATMPAAPMTTATTSTTMAVAGARSLVGTDIDGGWTKDARGRLAAGPDIIRLFDYFLSTTGEESAAAIRAHVVATARAQLAGEDQDAAMALYDRYIAYRTALQSALAGATTTDARAALAVVESTQQQIFGGDATALFGDENALAEVLLERREILMRQDLDEAGRAAALAGLEDRLPASMRAARAARAELAAAVAREVAAR